MFGQVCPSPLLTVLYLGARPSHLQAFGSFAPKVLPVEVVTLPPPRQLRSHATKFRPPISPTQGGAADKKRAASLDKAAR